LDLMHPARRPKRLWLAAILDILIAILGIVMVVFLLTSTRVANDLKPSALNAAVSLVPASLLLLYAVLAIKGLPSARRALLLVATVYFGTIIAQNALLLWGTGETIVPSRKLLANVVRSSFSLGINWWALSSLKTKLFFAARVLPPIKSLERTREE